MLRVLSLSLVLLCANAFGQSANDIKAEHRDSGNTTTVTKWLTTPGPGAIGVFIMNNSGQPEIVTVSNLSLDISNQLRSTMEWVDISNVPLFSSIAYTGYFEDAIGAPIRPGYPIDANQYELVMGWDSRLNGNASNISTGTIDVARLPTAIPAPSIAGGGVSNTEFGYLDGVTSALQSQLNGKSGTAHTHVAADVTDSTTVGRSVLTASNAAAARTAIGAGTSSFDGSYASLTSVPSTFTPSTHTHAAADITSGTLNVARLPTGIDAANIGGGAVSNTEFSYVDGVTSGIQTQMNLKSRVYVGTTLKNNVFPIFKNATVSSGTAVFHLTADGTSGGTALCSEVFADSIQVIVSDATASYQMSWALSNSDKTVTVTANKLTTSNILTGVLGQAAANTAVVKLSVFCA